MDLRNLAFGRPTPDPQLRAVFTPPGGSPRARGDILATFLQGRTDPGAVRVRDQVLGLAERLNVVNGAQREAAGAPARAATAGFANVTLGGPAGMQPRVDGGLYAQLIARNQGLVGSTPGPAAAPVRAVAHTPAAAPAAAPAAVAGAAGDAVVGTAQLERELISGFERLGALDRPQYLSALVEAVDAGAAAGHGDDAFAVLARTVAGRPLEHSVPALNEAVERIGQATAHAAATAAPFADSLVRPGAIGLHHGVEDTLRLLARF